MARKLNPGLRGVRVLITAGPTHEYLDDVRYLGNPSTGRMGMEIARAAIQLGAKATVVCGPSHLKPPPGARLVPVVTADDMLEAVDERFGECDLFVAAAAVSDYRPLKRASGKIKKSRKRTVLELIRNPDVLRQMGKRRRDGQTLVGFSLESTEAIANARRKLALKHCDLMVVNSPGHFGESRERVTVISADGVVAEVPPSSKRRIAEALCALVADLRAGRELPLLEGW